MGEVIVTGRPTHRIPLGNLLDDANTLDLATAITTDTYTASASTSDLGVDRVVQGGAASFSLFGSVNFNFTNIGWTSSTQGTISNDALVSTQSGNIPVPISTQKFRAISKQVNETVELEDGLSISANSAITFDLDELRNSGDFTTSELLRFVADRVGPNDASPVGSINVHSVVIIGDAAGVLVVAIRSIFPMERFRQVKRRLEIFRDSLIRQSAFQRRFYFRKVLIPEFFPELDGHW
ncbi:MAG: hypothetical protein SGI77_14625 [Pirellulaceae bacterium]|nr:hypothetical protein [Pirellulaceae bacterium]